MKGISFKFIGSLVSSRDGWAGALAVAMVLSGVRADGAAIRHEDLSSADATAMAEWSRYLKAGPSAWKDVLHPPVTPMVTSIIWHDIKTDPGGVDPMVAYLLWKQSIDPTRFAHYHPNLAPALDRIRASTPSTSLAPQGLNPPPTETSSPPSTSMTTSTPTTGEQGINPPAAPEPSTLLMVLGMAGWGIWQGRRRKSRA